MIDITPLLNARISSGAFRVLVTLASSAGGETRESRTSSADLEQITGQPRRTVQRQLAELEAAGYLIRTRSGYQIVTAPKMAPAPPVAPEAPKMARPLAPKMAPAPPVAPEAPKMALKIVSPLTLPSSLTEKKDKDKDQDAGAHVCTHTRTRGEEAERRVMAHAARVWTGVDRWGKNPELSDLETALGWAMAEFGEGWIVEAITLAGKKPAGWSYGLAILRRWKAEGSGPGQVTPRTYRATAGPSHGGHTAATMRQPERHAYETREEAIAYQRRLAAALSPV